MIEALIERWNEHGQDHHNGADLLDLADQIIAQTTTAEEIAQLPYAFGNWCGSWYQVGRRAAGACDKLAEAALARDPDNEAALWLYAQKDFLDRVGRKRAPIVPPPIAKRIAKIERILELYIEDHVHPLDIPSLETIVIDHPLVLDAMIACFERAPEGRGRHAFIEALGGTLIDHDRVVKVFVRELELGRDVDDIAMAMHYGLRSKAAPALEAFIAVSKRLVAELTAAESDWRHTWALRTTRTLTKHARGARRAGAQAFLTHLRTDSAMPAWKREKLSVALSS